MSEAGHMKPVPQHEQNVARQECGLSIARVYVYLFSPDRTDILYILYKYLNFKYWQQI